MQQLLELFDLQAKQALRSCYQALAHHVGRELYHRHRVGLGRARLQQVEPAALHGKLNVLRLAVVALKLPAHADQLGVGAGHLGAHEINGLGRARAGHHVLALRVDQVLAEQAPAAVAGIAREHDPGGAVAAHVAKHHRDYVDGRPVRHVGRDALLPAVHDGALAHPAAEYRAHGHLELPVGIRRKPLARVLFAHPLELGDDPAQRRGIKVAVALGAGAPLCSLQHPLEPRVSYPKHDLAEQLDKPPVRVPRKPLAAAGPCEALDRAVVYA